MKVIVVLLLLSLSVFAQTPSHSVTLTWQDSLNPSGTTYNVYRATGLCSGTPSFTKVASGIVGLTYQDATVQPGSYCYEMTATSNGVESAPSNTVQPQVPSFPPSNLSFQVQ